MVTLHADTMSMKVLLLNPPGSRAYIRDYYCSKIAKSNYCPHPVDLLILSGLLSATAEVQVLDAIADRIDRAASIRTIDDYSPDVIISLIGAVSYEEDCAFLADIRTPERQIVVTGDTVLENAGTWLEQHPYIDAVLLDFTSPEIIDYLLGTTAPLPCIVSRLDFSRDVTRVRQQCHEYRLPVPRHDLFTSPHYRFPFVRRKEFATVLTDYGCPFACAFCNMPGIGYKYRAVDNVLAELRLIRDLGKKEIFFIDQTFGVSKERALTLCAAMVTEGLHFGWVCFSRADLVDEELLDAMQRSGCHTIIFGVETADEALLAHYTKGCSTAKIAATFKLCRGRKIRTVATFILGLPEETEESARKTIAFAKELDPDFVSFNVAVPRVGTLLRQQSIAAGLAVPEATTMDQSGTEIAMPTRFLNREQLQRIRRDAVVGFYLRPGYLWRRIKAVSSWYELRQQLVEGWEMFRNVKF